MPSIDQFSAKQTSVEYVWPKGTLPVERIMLSAHGDLQRIMSAYFARPITIALIFSNTSPALLSTALTPSPSSPTSQKRQVHLVCSGKTVCIATSTVTISSPQSAQLFLKEGYAIGQTFRKLGVTPKFELLEAGLANDDQLDEQYTGSYLGAKGKQKLWRRYTLKTEGFETEIVEVFPDREMFLRGEAWLEESELPTVMHSAGGVLPWTPQLPNRTIRSAASCTPSVPMSTDPFSEHVNDAQKSLVAAIKGGALRRCLVLLIGILILLVSPHENFHLTSLGTFFRIGHRPCGYDTLPSPT